ncbi:T9SS sorting signal type C domain-containing protein [Winogradskyella luteola]|uniref:T9SS sorting signal type C domain-containing protein n=1 Tax=Winogradskyella luteola TaxID=2828330 RepID=A0A9X1JS70_9FLAO|nr:T9SS sorting signal type C domain-containing protein [Winogradskyella luteola]MBV7269332.1 T9SS sorting signal type C domain-containing protein [Winogradskyella luteola]
MIKKILFLIACALSTYAFSQANNCNNNAIGELTVGDSCNFQSWDSNNNSDYWNAADTNGNCNEEDLDDAWGWFNATSTSTTVSYQPYTEDAILTLFEGNCNTNATAVACSDDGFDGDAEVVTYATTIGTRYRVRIQRYNSNNNMSGAICVYNSNDDCGSATVLIPGTPCVSTLSSNVGATSSLTGCTGFADADVWFQFTASDTEQTITVRPGNIDDAVFEVFDGSCGALNSLICVDDTSNDLETTTLTGLTVGSVYFIRVYNFWGNIFDDEGSFYICVTEPCVQGPGTGTSDFGCAAVDVMDSTGNDTVEITCNNIGSTVALEASYLELGDTNSYTSEVIPYNPPYQFGCLTNPVSINDDDVWSPQIDFSSNNFDFCFYGQSYNSCVMNSNGVISFDTSLENLYTGWEINNALPSTANSTDYLGGSPIDYFFGPSIYGVHHDIDPRAGGEIGWEFVDLTTNGSTCRALVASWHDVPMFADPTILYSGMIVLYENTNVIEVYIEEKNMDVFDASYNDIWNFGNAQIGIQNATGTQAEVVRDIADGDWTATSQAWRFAPSGTSITSLIWLEDGVHNTAYDDDATISVSPTATTTYTAEVTYNLCNASVITRTDDFIITVNQAKVWNGSVDNNWFVDNNWTPSGEPTINDCVIIPDNTSVPNNPLANQLVAPIPLPPTTPAEARNLTLQAGAYLEIETNTELIVNDWVNVESTAILNLKSSSSLIQVDDSALNSGSIHVQRSPNFDESPVGNTEYIYWSSPVESFSVNNISPSSNLRYDWIPTVTGNGVGNHGEWSSSAGTMADGKGYIVRGLGGTPNTIPATTYPVANNMVLFSGVPNNGVITKQIFHGNYDAGDYMGNGNTATSADDNWNLIGNPYPSAISANAFTNFNTNINGTIYLWPHSSAPSAIIDDPFYEDFVYNYDTNAYIEHNNTGSNPPGTNDLYIASGQAFFVLMNHAATSGSNVTFNNSMREFNVLAYSNNDFYRSNSEEQNTNVNNKHRIWLDLLSPNNNINTILVGYVQNATNDFDRLYDGYDFSQESYSFYSLLNEKALSIQGRELPFEDTDTVPLGIVSAEAGSHTIAINTVDGLFNGQEQDIYLEDTELDIIHNLRVFPYSFHLDAGTHNDRFILRYNNSTLGIDDLEVLNGIQIFEENNKIVVKSNFETIEAIEVYDILGRTLFSNKPINSNRFSIKTIEPSEIILFLKIKLVDGKQKIAKIIF